MFKKFLSRLVPALNSPGDQNLFGHLAAQKFLKQVTYLVSELSPGLTRAMKQVLSLFNLPLSVQHLDILSSNYA
jgi:hypothetical protein